MPITSADIVPFNKARAELTRLAEEVREGHEKIITRNGESYVALVDARRLDYYHQLERDRQAGADFHIGLLNDAIEGLQEIRDGKPGVGLDELRQEARRKIEVARIGAERARA